MIFFNIIFAVIKYVSSRGKPCFLLRDFYGFISGIIKDISIMARNSVVVTDTLCFTYPQINQRTFIRSHACAVFSK